MKSSTKRIVSIGLSFIFFSAILFVYVNFITPELTEVQKQRAVVVAKENLFNGQKAAVEEVQKVLSEFQSVAQLQQTISLALPLAENTTQVLNQLQAIALNSQTNISSLDIEPIAFTASKEPIIRRLGGLGLGITVSGSYEAVKNFLRFLETNVRLMNVKNLEVRPGAAQGRPQDFYSLILKAETYYQE